MSNRKKKIISAVKKRTKRKKNPFRVRALIHKESHRELNVFAN